MTVPRTEGRAGGASRLQETRPGAKPLSERNRKRAERSPPPERPRWRTLRVIAQDPTLLDEDDRVVLSKIRVPYEQLEAGPRGHRFHIVDHDSTTGKTSRATVIPESDAGLALPRALRSKAGRAFRAQNLYAIAARTLNIFETALGRRVPWGFAGHQLYLVPEGFEEANAFYAEQDQAIYFGYANDGPRRIYTSLSHDIVTHEITHAILDGLRDRYDTPGLPDQSAFHEAFADITALLSAFALPELVEVLLRRAMKADEVSVSKPHHSGLGLVVGNLAAEVGTYVHGDARAEGLRNSYRLYEKPEPEWRTNPEFSEPHRRGEVLVAAVIGALTRIWLRRIEPVARAGNLDARRMAQEGANAAEHVLKMSVRCLDYCPPLEFEFDDFLNALITSDREMEPDDRYGYRPALLEAFARFGIRRPRNRITDFSRNESPPSYENFNYLRLREDPDELYRFVWENSNLLGVDRRWYTRVEHVRRVLRVAADGFVVEDAIVDYVQELQGFPNDLTKVLGFPLSGGLPLSKEYKLYGGGVLIFDQFGRLKFHQHKPLVDRRRQRARARYLVTSGRNDSRNRFGFSERIPEGQRFAEIHRPGLPIRETW